MEEGGAGVSLRCRVNSNVKLNHASVRKGRGRADRTTSEASVVPWGSERGLRKGERQREQNQAGIGCSHHASARHTNVMAGATRGSCALCTADVRPCEGQQC